MRVKILAVAQAEIKAVIAKSFARIFYRNAINIGLVIIENDKIQDEIDKNDEIKIDLDNGKIINLTKKKEYSFSPYSKEVQNLIDKGGLINYTKEKISK